MAPRARAHHPPAWGVARTHRRELKHTHEKLVDVRFDTRTICTACLYAYSALHWLHYPEGSIVMHHRLIMVAGSSPGVGKSTLSHVLFQQFMAHAMPVHWFYEEDLGQLPAFAPFLQALSTSPPQIEVFLHAVAAFVPTCVAMDATIITDSFLPGHLFFFGSYPRPMLETFNQQVYRLLQPLHPLLIYLQSDILAAYARAIRQRGVVWQERLLGRMNTWQLPLYPHTPFRDLHDVICFEQ